MRILFSFLISLCLLMGCNTSSSSLDEWSASNHKLKVLSTTPIIDELVRRVGGERIEHRALIDGCMDPHSYEMVKGDEEKFARAQIIFYNGLGLEHAAALTAQLKAHPHAIALGEEIYDRYPTLILHERGHADPHIWLDVSLWEKAVDPVVFHLSSVDPEGKEYYTQKGLQLKQELNDLDRWIKDKLGQIAPQKRYLVTSHDAFNYFTRRYLEQEGEQEGRWKERFCAPEGLAPDGQLSFQDLERVIAHLHKHQVHTLFPETNVSQDSLKKIVDICRAKKIEVNICSHSLFSDTLSEKKSKNYTYEEMMKHNAQVLYEAWKHG